MILARRTWVCHFLCFPVLAFLVENATAEALAIPGYTKPFKDEILSITVPGTIARIYFREGDRVRKGDVLLDLDKRQEELEVERRKLIMDSRAEVDSAAARVATAKSDLNGTRKVFEATKSVSQEELEKKELEWKLSCAELARLEIGELREKIEYEMAKEQLSKRSLTAPIDGTIAKLHQEEGETCEPRQPLVRLVDVTTCYFIVNVEAKLVQHLRKEQTVTLAIDTGTTPYTCNGTVTFVSPITDAASGLQEIKILFPNPDGIVHPGVTGKILVSANQNEP